jgi:hypothetical protein
MANGLFEVVGDEDMPKYVAWLPCRLFFAAGRPKLGVIALLMQLSLVLWPLASDWARQFARDSDLEKRLDELVRDYRLPADHPHLPKKRFATAG